MHLEKLQGELSMKKNNTVKWLFSVPGRNKLYILALMFVQAIVGASGVLYAVLLKDMVDSATRHDAHSFWMSVVYVCLLITAQILLSAFARWLSETTLATFDNLFKSRLIENILKRDFARVQAVHSGEWLNRLTNDTGVVAGSYVQIFPGLTGMFTKLISAVFMMIILDWRFACILVPSGLLLMVITYLFRKKMKKLHKDVQEKDGKLRIFLQERIGNLMIIRSYAAEKRTLKEAKYRLQEHKASRMRRMWFSNFCNVGFSFAMSGIYIIGAIYCCHGILIGSISFGTMTAITQLISQIQSPFAGLSGVIPQLYTMAASAERLMEIESFDEEDQNSLSLEDVKTIYGERLACIGLKNADYTYYPNVERVEGLSKDDQPVVINDISIEIGRGEYVAFMGHSGCGKSTVLKLLMSIYPLDAGERYIKFKDGSADSLDSKYHRLFAYVPQGNGLMSGTIREIVSFADEARSCDDAAIKKALELACADEFVYELEQGIDTLLGERGTGLSEGQMQRISIARALFSGSPILLFDEATSALDEETERKLLENLRRMTDKTVVIVTHRRNVLEICDRVVEFGENGVLEKNG